MEGRSQDLVRYLVEESHRKGAISVSASSSGLPARPGPARGAPASSATSVITAQGAAHWHPVFGWFAHKLSEPYAPTLLAD